MGWREDFPEKSVEAQLNLILSAPAFKNSSILSGFLRFVVTETIAGREQELKEYTIGINALSRNHDFNPQLDAIVRIHAGRLRRALKEYYVDGGSVDPIYIEIPKGSYIPVFQRKNTIESVDPKKEKSSLSLQKKPIVAVLPFRNISSDHSRDYFADGLCEQLSTELSRFQDLTVISYYSSRHVAGKTTDIGESARLLGAKYILTGSMQSDNKHLRVRVQLILAENSEHLWAKSFERKYTASGLFEIQDEIVRSVLTAIGGYYGAIYRDMMKAPVTITSASTINLNSIEIYDAIFWYYHFQKVYTNEALFKTIEALENAVKVDPQYALAWAMLAELYMDSTVVELKKMDNPLGIALECAQRAVTLDPTCQHAWMALAWVSLFDDREKSIKAADKCIEINPNSADKIGSMGFVLCCAGEFERGLEMLDDSIKQNPYCPWWFHTAYCFYYLHKQDYVQTLHRAETIDSPQMLWDPLLKAVALSHLNRMEEGEKYLKKLMDVYPDAGSQIKDMIESFLHSKLVTGGILEGLSKLGLEIEGYQPVYRLKFGYS